jgi:beta-lactamase class A
LGLAVILISVGPQTLRELMTGVNYARPPVAAIPAPAEPHAEVQLQTDLDAVRARLPRGQLSAVLIDLTSGATATVDADRGQAAASLFKIPILLEVQAQQAGGRATLNPTAQLEIQPDDWTDGSGVLQARVGERLTVRELTRLMIQESDNIAALVLLDAVGVEAVNARLRGLGLHDTHLVDRRAGGTGDHVTTAADMARLMELLATGQAIDAQVSEEVLRLLELKQSVSWVTDELPFWVKVAHKWGDLPGTRNEAAIVFSPRGSYVVVVLTEGSAPEEAARAIARTSRVAYDFVGRAPPSAS